MRIIRWILHCLYQVWAVGLFCIFILIGTIFSAILIVFIRKRALVYHIMSLACRVWAFSVYNRIENIYLNDRHHPPAAKTCIYICNHESYLDIPTLYGARLPFFLFLSKEEVLSIPIVGFLCKQLAITVKREHLRSKKDAMELLMSTIHQQQVSVCIFPEGTFYADKEEVIDFQLGAFSLAIKCHLPIYPLLLLDTRQRLHPKSVFSFSYGRNRIVHLAPITAHLEGEPMNALELMHLCRKKMIEVKSRF